MVVFLNSEEDLDGWIQMKDVSLTNDGMPMFLADGSFPSVDMPLEDYEGHPRNIGTRARVLRMSREAGVPLMQAVHNTSYTVAKYLSMLGLEAMQERGRMQEGMIADITIFDPEAVTDNATYAPGEQCLPNSGIPYVIVNGVIVVRDSKVVLGITPGQPIRYPVMK